MSKEEVEECVGKGRGELEEEKENIIHSTDELEDAEKEEEISGLINLVEKDKEEIKVRFYFNLQHAQLYSIFYSKEMDNM